MKVDKQNRVKRKTSWLARLLTAAMLLTLVPASTLAEGGNKKLAADLANFPVNSDGTVSVIIQFKETPQARHFEMMAARGGKLRFSLERINGAAYRIPVKQLAWLERHPDVAYVTPDRVNQVASGGDQNSNDDIAAVLGDYARQQFAVDGAGVGVAVIDSGVSNHDDLQNSNGLGSRIVYSESFVPGDPSTSDAYGHGTHVAGIVAGNGFDSQIDSSVQYTGVAPNANIINLRVLDANGAGTDSQVIAGIQRAIQLKSVYNIRVINLSLGRPVFESFTLDPVCQAVEAAWQSGIVVVVAAGNSGRDDTFGTQGYATINAPGNDPNVITVGATKTNGTGTRIDDTVASYSSKGPTLIDHIVKPDLVAPGNRVVSLDAPGNKLSTLNSGFIVGTNGKYLRLSGTSMASPVVAGAAALMIQKDPTLTPDIIKARMMKTAWKGYPVSSWGFDIWGHGHFSQYDVFTIGAGYLDIYSALKNTDVVNGGAPSPVAVFNPATGKVTLNNSLSITWGNSITWGSNSIIWGNSIVWGGNAVSVDSIVWGDSIIWGQMGIEGNSIIWGNSIVWGADSVTGLSDSEDGEN